MLQHDPHLGPDDRAPHRRRIRRRVHGALGEGRHRVREAIAQRQGLVLPLWVRLQQALEQDPDPGDRGRIRALVLAWNLYTTY